MSVKFLSKEWLEENRTRLTALFNKPSRVETSLIEVFENGPDGKDVWVKLVLEKGILSIFDYGVGKETIPKAKFIVFGNASEFTKIFKGEKEVQTALMTNAFRLEGSLMEALSQIGIYKKIVKSRKEIDTEY